MKFLEEMAEFAGKHWLGLSVLAAMTGGVLCFFFPPLLVSGFAMALASYPAFGAALGAYAGSAALAVMSGVVGFSALGVFAFIRNFADIVDGFVGLFKPKAKAFVEGVPPASASESKDKSDARILSSDFEIIEGTAASANDEPELLFSDSKGQVGTALPSAPESIPQAENLIKNGIFSAEPVVPEVIVERSNSRTNNS